MTKVESIGIKNTISSEPNQNIKTNTNNNSTVNEQKKIYTKLMVGASALAATIVSGLVITNQIKKGKMAKLAQQLEQEAVEREQAYIDKTYNALNKSAKESAEFYETYYKNQEYVAKLKKYMHQKSPLNAETIDARLNSKNPELDALNNHYSTMVEEEAAKREQDYIDKTYITVNKSAENSARIIDQYFTAHEKAEKILQDADLRAKYNIPPNSNPEIIHWGDYYHEAGIKKSNGIIVSPSEARTGYHFCYIPIGRNKIPDYAVNTINGKKYLRLRMFDKEHWISSTTDHLFGTTHSKSPVDLYMEEFQIEPEAKSLVEKFIKSEKADYNAIVLPGKIKEFKDKYQALLPTLKLSEKDKFVYENGNLYIQKADGSVIREKGIWEKECPLIEEKTPKKLEEEVGDDVEPWELEEEVRDDVEPWELEEEVREIECPEFGEGITFGNSIWTKILSRIKPSETKNGNNIIEFNGKKYVETAQYEPTANGLIKTHFGKNARTIEVDKTLGEFSIEKDGYKYYYSIKGRELLDIKKIEKNGKPVKLGTYSPKNGGSTPDRNGTPEIILIKLRGGGTAELYKMPDGRILTPFEFHFPGAAKAEKDAIEYFERLEDLMEHERLRKKIKAQLKFNCSKEEEVIIHR